MSAMVRKRILAASVASIVPLVGPAFVVTEGRAANIIVVAEERGDLGHVPLQDFLRSEGHTLTIGTFADAPPDAPTLAANDLILVQREANSGSYDDDDEELAWNAITLPILSLNAFIERGPAGGNTRWSWVSGNSRPNVPEVTEASAFDPFPDPSHPFLNGVGSTTILSGATFGQNALSAAHELPEGGTVVATIGGQTAYGLYTIPAGAETFGQGTLGGMRVAFVVGAEGSWANVTADGQQILRNIIASLADGGGVIGDADGDGDVDGNDIAIWAQNFTGSGATGGTRSRGDFDGDGDIDGDDAAAWAQNFTGSLSGAGAATAVPEASVAQLLLPFFMMVRRRYRGVGARFGAAAAGPVERY